MKWLKQGHIFSARADSWWNLSHAQCPTALPLSNGRLRIYYGTRDAQVRTRTSFIEVAADDPSQILYVHDAPIMDLGAPGTFDDSGVMPSWFVWRNGRLYFYYIGWNTGRTVSYRNAIGLAVSDDGGVTFERVYDGPIMDRSRSEPHFCATPCVLPRGDGWQMWYLSTTKWEDVDGKMEPFYHIKYAESADGVDWQRAGHVAIPYATATEGGIARPTVIKRAGGYRMWFCYRDSRGYRTDINKSYRIGYAVSADGVDWQRCDQEAGIEVSDSGWDDFMVAYPHVIPHGDRLLMFYNGNGFGQRGFGYATLPNRDQAPAERS